MLILDISIGLFAAGAMIFGIFTSFRKLVPVDTALALSLLINSVLLIIIKLYIQ